MTVTVRVPGPLQALAGGAGSLQVEVEGRTVADALAALRERNRGVYDRIVTEQGEIREHVNVFLGTENVRFTGGLATALVEGRELVILPAVSGG